MPMQERYYPVEGSSARAPVFLNKRPDLKIIKGRKAVAENFLNGFDSQVETEALKRNYNNAARGRRLVMMDGLQPVINENLANMSSHPKEYTMSDPVVRNPVRFNKKDQFVNDESGYVIEDMITDEERGGATRASVVNAQKKLSRLKTGDLVIWISSVGPTGRYESGREIVYEETQVYVFKKGSGRLIEGITFICDLTYEQCLKLYGKYEAPDPSMTDLRKSELSRVSEMAKRPISVTGNQARIVNVLDNIQAIMGGKVMRKANGKNRTFDEARELLYNPSQLKELPEKCRAVLDKYQEYLEANLSQINDEKVFNAIKQRMEIAMLEITRIINNLEVGSETRQELPTSFLYIQAFDENNTDKIDYKLIKNNYEAEIQYLVTRPGCLGKIGGDFLTGQELGDILSGQSNIISFPGSEAVGKSAESGGTCKICRMNKAVKGGCGYCEGCAKAA